tara:strand:+ start:62 stop:430 length:369 start_codon:yes stop_codon:yes gene_type:complete
MGKLVSITVPVKVQGRDTYINPDDPADFTVKSIVFDINDLRFLKKQENLKYIRLDIKLSTSPIINLLVEREYFMYTRTYTLVRDYINNIYKELLITMGQSEKVSYSMNSLLKSVGLRRSGRR